MCSITSSISKVVYSRENMSQQAKVFSRSRRHAQDAERQHPVHNTLTWFRVSHNRLRSFRVRLWRTDGLRLQAVAHTLVQERGVPRPGKFGCGGNRCIEEPEVGDLRHRDARGGRWWYRARAHSAHGSGQGAMEFSPEVKSCIDVLLAQPPSTLQHISQRRRHSRRCMTPELSQICNVCVHKRPEHNKQELRTVEQG